MRNLKEILFTACRSIDKAIGFVVKHGRAFGIGGLWIIAIVSFAAAYFDGGIVSQTVNACGDKTTWVNPIAGVGMVAAFFATIWLNSESEEEKRERLYGHRYFSRIHRL